MLTNEFNKIALDQKDHNITVSILINLELERSKHVLTMSNILLYPYKHIVFSRSLSLNINHSKMLRVA